MKSKEEMLAAKMLDLASDEFSNHGCNDVEESVYEGWTLDERKQFVKEFWEWNGSPEDYDEKFLHLQDHSIMAFLAFKLKLSADAAMHDFASRKPAGNWIEIKEGGEMPEDGQDVNIWTKKASKTQTATFRNMQFGRYTNAVQGDRMVLYYFPDVTHWQPLPAPPTNTSDTRLS